MSLKLDKRIKTITDIQSVTFGCNDWESHKKGYFANRIADFKDLSKCMYGKYVEYRYHDKCFLCEVDLSDGTSDRDWYTYFISEDTLNPTEKKYRPYRLREFLHKFKFGEAIYIRPKNSKTNEERMVIFSEYRTELYKDESNDAESVCLTGIEHHLKSVVCLGVREYDLTTLFDNYEYFDGKEWKIFGAKE